MKPCLIAGDDLAEHFRALGCHLVAKTLDFDVLGLSHVEDGGPGTLSWHRGGELPPGFHGSALVAHSETSVDGAADLVAYHENPRMVLRRTLEKYKLGAGTLPHIDKGLRCNVHPSAVLGAEGQGYDREEGGWVAFPHSGGVRLGSDVDIGPCATIMRGSIGDTVIGSGCKIGNGVNIGHDTRIRPNTLIVAGALIAGWVRIGTDVKIWQGAIVKNGIRIGDGAEVGMGAIVIEDIPPSEVWAGSPARRIQ